MIMIQSANGWVGDVLAWQARDRLMMRREVVWDVRGVQFCGIDREWLRELGVLA